MAQLVNPYSGEYTLKYIKTHVDELYKSLSHGNPESKKAVSLILAYLMISNEVIKARDWDSAEAKIRRVISFDDELMYGILKLVYDNLSNEPYWRITPDFIYELGERYLTVITHRAIRELSQYN